MKKGLSVLLIAAALFGFYGGAVNLNDVLACKDYWEEEGERSTADMNKLEDGINQLKENEQAYLDGKDTVAEGEEALAEGEATLAAGQAELAKGEADYAAAPGKLADARLQIAKGEKDLAAGEKKLADGRTQIAAGEKKLAAGKKEYKAGQKSYKAAPKQIKAGEKKLAAGKKALKEGKQQLKGLAALISGINQILSGYKNDWKPGYEALKDGRSQLYKGSKGSADDLKALAAFLPDGSQSAYVAAVSDVTGDDEKQSAKDYKTFIKSTNTMEDALPQIQEAVKKAAAGAKGLYSILDGAKGSNVSFAKAVSENKSSLLAYSKFIEDAGLKAQYEGGIKQIAGAYEAMPGKIEKAVKEQMATDAVKAKIAALTQQYMEAGEDASTAQQKATAAVLEQVTQQVQQAAAQEAEANSDLTNGKPVLIGAIKQIADGLDAVNEKVNGDSSAIKNSLLPGLKKFNKAATSEAVDQLSDGQDTIAGGVSQIASGALSSSTLRKAIKKNLGASALTLLQTYKSSTNPLSTKISDFGKFYKQMNDNPGIVSALTKAKALLQKAKAEGEDTLADGEKELASGKKQLKAAKKAYKAAPAKLKAAKKQLTKGEKDLAAAKEQLAAGEKELAAGKIKLANGKKEYAKGLADYAAAPAKLAAGRAKLADGMKALEDGRAQLADGKKKLAEYEDGEQQVRDGLATLMGTEANGGLESILNRRGGDDDFDNGDSHLELDEGLDAVAAGRSYQADSGELITEEITKRAVGTGLGLGAGAFALLAGLLSLLKKNKGAGISAVLSAIAGGAGIAAGTSAGMEFSSIAGSAVGATPWIAFGILAAVAAVHAVAHFAAKEA